MSKHLTFQETALRGVFVVDRAAIVDERGYFERMFCRDELREMDIQFDVAQINHTLTKRRGSLRGLHFQFPPRSEIKLVSCLKGRVFDVAVDLRRGSPTYLKWHAEELSASSHRSLLISQGIAHGFQALEDESELLYVHSQFYARSFEGGFNPKDDTIGINWPLAVTEMSARDRGLPFVTADFSGIAL
jgi:dTDP-4-dehydrorhamnose 3,5-epimerase